MLFIFKVTGLDAPLSTVLALCHTLGARFLVDHGMMETLRTGS